MQIMSTTSAVVVRMLEWISFDLRTLICSAFPTLEVLVNVLNLAPRVYQLCDLDTAAQSNDK